MSAVDTKQLSEFKQDAEAWFRENTPREVDFLLPLTFMEVGTDQQFDFLRDWQRKVYEAGYLGAHWPKEFGGGGLDRAFQDVATKIMAAERTPLMLNAIGLNWTGPLLLDRGSKEEKQKYIQGILSAENIWCQGFSEPDHGSDLGNAQTRAVRDGDEYVINGSKIWTTQGNYADYMILLARTNPEAESKYKGLSFFLSPMKGKGIDTVPIRKLTGEYGFTQTFFEDARIPASCLMGAEGEGWLIAMQTLEYERGARSGQAGGHVMMLADPGDILELARHAHINGKPAIEDPSIREELVELMTEARSLGLNSRRDKIQPLAQDRPMSLALGSKLASTDFYQRLNAFAIAMQGTRGAYYVDDPQAHDNGIWQRGYLNSFSATIGGGTSQIQRNIIGEHVLGLPKG
ncbi:acyl-CoA dehydrogenase family protein [Alphaproteobacteria bacterium]|nr:acyl-CoA dehydrogenase family protein [Alphaproteobacteria bacterium]MDB2668404.1 acyl-CoA dehydrogenase family protein [Alphaproteobacteria bacterium]MDC0131784.1 acyl-CoA dehydrogenase family protein [Alphaproteobacteria bacterium]MDC0148357.1 acyl-CoA dehydrogenase family protein [Alphaproteobacteria bacterium]MDC1241068.1 acyl-CoA dehydrogenase family protein [bacterium]